MQVHEVMTSRVDLIGPETTIRDAALEMRDDDVGALPVGENDRLIGMVTDRDIAVRGVAAEKGNCSVRDVMSEGIYYCRDSDDADRASEIMAEHKVRRLPVLNDDKRLVGVVTLADLARVGAGQKAMAEVSEPLQAERL